MDKKVAIIGAGPAGLAAASLLASKNYNVVVYEANKTYGGKLGLLKVGESMFDAGPSLLTEPHVIDSIYKMCSKEPTHYWQYKKLELGTKYFWNDTKSYQMPADSKKIAKSLDKEFTLNPRLLQKYFQNIEYQYLKAAPSFLDKSFSLFDIRNLSKSKVFSRTLPYLANTAHKHNEKYFSDKKVVQIFDRFATYSGSDPYRGPALLNVAGAPEIVEGVYYPKGGMRSIVDGLYKLALDMGVKFEFGNATNKITKGDRFIVTTREGQSEHDIVVFAGDYVNIFKLLGQKIQFKRMTKKRSSSGIVFYWQVKGRFKQLGLHNIIFSEDYQKEFNALQQSRLIPEPTIYINITSKLEPSLAKKGHENWFVMLNVPANYKARDIHKLEAQTKNRIEGVLKQKIVITAKDQLDPKKIEQTSLSYKGAIYGHDSNSLKRAILKPKNQLKEYPGLYCIGGSVHPGGGVPLSIRSAKIIAEQL